MDKNDGNDYSVRDAESSASKALERVRKDPDNSGRAARTNGEQASASRLARQGQTAGKSTQEGRQRTADAQGRTRQSGEGQSQGRTRQSGEEQSQGRTRQSGEGQSQGRTGQSGDGQAQGRTRQSGDGQAQGRTRQSGDGQAQGRTRQSGDGQAQGRTSKPGEGQSQNRRTQGSDGQSQTHRRQSLDGQSQGRKTQAADGSRQARRRPQTADGQYGERRTKREDSARESERRAEEARRRQFYEDDDEVKINRSKRTWNKYKNYLFIGAAVLVALIFIVTGIKSCARKQKEEEASLYSQPSMGALQVSTAAVENESPSQGESQTQQATKGMVLSTTKTAADEDYTSQSFYDNSVFIGDSIVNGIAYYKYLDSSRTVSDLNLTASKATDKVKEIVAKSPERVYIMLGINDLNYNTKTPDSIAEDFVTLINQIRQELPTAGIYVISVTPITSAFESKSTTYVKMTNVEALNTKLKEMAQSSGNYYFVDINSSLQDSSGYMNSDLTGNGYGLKITYYAFLLNTIAELTK